MVLKSNSATPKHIWLFVVKITAEQPISAQEMAVLNAKQLKKLSLTAAQSVKGMPAQSQTQNVDLTAQAKSPDIFDAIQAAGALADTAGIQMKALLTMNISTFIRSEATVLTSWMLRFL